MQSRHLAIALAISATCSFAISQDLIIESRPEGKNNDKYNEPVGRWLDSNTPAQTAKSGAPDLTPQGQAGTRKLTIPLTPSNDPKEIVGSARFTPKFSEPGHYHVYVTWPKAANATPVNYVIKHAKGEEVRSLAQDGWGALGPSNAGVWIKLGEFDFNAGDDQYVELQATGATGQADGRTAAQVMADAVRFSTQPVTDSISARAGPAPTPSAAQLTASAPAPSAVATSAQAPSAAPQVADNTPLTWDDNIQAAQTTAASSGKRIFVFFYSPENERSRNYDGKVFQDPRVKQLLRSKFIPVRINIDENRSLASNLQVFRAGTINIYDKDGNGLAQYTETLDAEELANRLDRI